METGFLVSRDSVEPVIYVIVVDAYIYIGETTAFPAQRWSSHLAPGGSLRKKLFAIDDRFTDWWKPLQFFSFSCASDLQYFKESQRKTALQAVEHQVHCDLGSRPGRLSRKLQVISDTEKTAPRFWRDWRSTRVIAHRIVEDLAAALVQHSINR